MVWSEFPEEASEREPDASAAYKSALRSLSTREMSGFEVARGLRRKGHPAAVAKEVVDRLRAEGWVDDARFAAAFLRYRIRSRPAALRHLRAELAQRGCDASSVEDAVARVREDVDLDDAALARAAASRRRGADARDPERLLRFLARRGFSLEVARGAISALEPDHEDESGG